MSGGSNIPQCNVRGLRCSVRGLRSGTFQCDVGAENNVRGLRDTLVRGYGAQKKTQREGAEVTGLRNTTQCNVTGHKDSEF